MEPFDWEWKVQQWGSFKIWGALKIWEYIWIENNYLFDGKEFSLQSNKYILFINKSWFPEYIIHELWSFCVYKLTLAYKIMVSEYINHEPWIPCVYQLTLAYKIIVSEYINHKPWVPYMCLPQRKLPCRENNHPAQKEIM